MRSAAALAAGAALALLAVPAVALYEHRPPPAHTGGFGEATCASCHFDNELNADGGVLAVDGLPDHFTPGQRYRLSITLQHPELRRGGFQMAIRFTGPERAGEQAGSFHVRGDEIEVVEAVGVSYVQHTRDGSRAVDGAEARWTVEWEAPAVNIPISLHVAANAANGDASEFGDHVYRLERKVEAAH